MQTAMWHGPFKPPFKPVILLACLLVENTGNVDARADAAAHCVLVHLHGGGRDTGGKASAVWVAMRQR